MIIKKEKKGDVTVYYVDKDIPDGKMETLKNTLVKRNKIKLIIDSDADVYTKEGKLLLKFRKNKLPEKDVKDFYDNVINFALKPTNNRGSASGSAKKNVYDNPKIMTNIIGYFDKFSPSQKFILKNKNKNLLDVRATRFVT